MENSTIEILWQNTVELPSSILFIFIRRHGEIGQLQADHCKLQHTEACLHHLWCFGLYWHRREPEIGQFQGDHSELLHKEALLHLWRFGLCWHQNKPEIGQLQSDCKLLCAKALIHPSLVPWSLLAPEATRNRTTSM